MARHNVYLKDKIENEIKDIIALGIQNGASKAEMNVSSMVNELCRLGLMIYKSSENKSSFNLDTYRRESIRKTAGAREGVLMLTAMMTEMYLKQSGVTDSGKIDEIIRNNLDNFYKAENDAETRHFVVD